MKVEICFNIVSVDAKLKTKNNRLKQMSIQKALRDMMKRFVKKSFCSLLLAKSLSNLYKALFNDVIISHLIL